MMRKPIDWSMIVVLAFFGLAACVILSVVVKVELFYHSSSSVELVHVVGTEIHFFKDDFGGGCDWYLVADTGERIEISELIALTEGQVKRRFPDGGYWLKIVGKKGVPHYERKAVRLLS